MKVSPDSQDTIVQREPVPGNPNEVRVLFHIHIPLTLTVMDWVDLGLKVGMSVSPEFVRQIESRAALVEAERIAVVYLTGRVRTCAQVREVLIRKGIAEDVAQSVIHRLSERGVLDDVRYAQMFVEQAGARWGRQQLIGRLLRRGIAKEIARDAVAAHLAPEQESASARAAADKFVRQKGLPKTPKEQAKLMNYLARRGFSAELAYAIARQLGENDGESPIVFS